MKEKKWPITVIKVLLGVLMISGGIQHFRSPDLYIPFVPSFLPLTVAIIYVTGLLEIIFGLALFSREWIGMHYCPLACSDIYGRVFEARLAVSGNKYSRLAVSS